MSVKVSSRQWNLPLTINISLNGCEWKKYLEKRLLKMLLTQDEVLMGQRLWSKYQCEIFNFVNLCSGVGMVWSTKTQTRVSHATAATFSVKCFNPLKLHPLSGNIFRKWFASYFLFIHKNLIIIWPPTINLIAEIDTSRVTTGVSMESSCRRSRSGEVRTVSGIDGGKTRRSDDGPADR